MDNELSTTAPSTGKTNGKWNSKENRGSQRQAGSNMDDHSLQERVVSGAKDAYDSVIKNIPASFSRVLPGVRSTVSQYPVQSALGCLAVGFLLGSAISMRRSE